MWRKSRDENRIRQILHTDPYFYSDPYFYFRDWEYDGETGLYHYRTRAYSPELGRFLQPNSIDFFGGDINLYRYVSNNPTNKVDPFGLEECDSSQVGERRNVKYSTVFTPGGSSPTEEALKKLFDRAIGRGFADKITKAFVGVQ